jgi:hypothetical protein
MKAVRWVQQDWLRAEGTEPAIFVFDAATVADYSLKRIQFLYECLLELPVEIRCGSYEEEVADFARTHGARTILTTASPDSRVQKAMKSLSHAFELVIEEPEPFVTPPRRPDLRRFARYWSSVERLLIPRDRSLT